MSKAQAYRACSKATKKLFELTLFIATLILVCFPHSSSALTDTIDFSGVWAEFKVREMVSSNDLLNPNNLILLIDKQTIFSESLKRYTGSDYPYSLSGSTITTNLINDFIKLSLAEEGNDVNNMYIGDIHFSIIQDTLLHFTYKMMLGSPLNLSKQMNMVFVRIPGTTGTGIQGCWLLAPEGSKYSFSDGEVIESYFSIENKYPYKNDPENNVLTFFQDSIIQVDYEVIAENCIKVGDYDYLIRTDTQTPKPEIPESTPNELLNLAYKQLRSISWTNNSPDQYFKVLETLSQIDSSFERYYEVDSLWQKATIGAVNCTTTNYRQTRGIHNGITPSFEPIAQALEYSRHIFNNPVIGNYEARQQIVHTLIGFAQTMCHGSSVKNFEHLLYTDGHTFGCSEFDAYLFTYGEIAPLQDEMLYTFIAKESGRMHGICQVVKNSRISALSLNNDLFSPFYADFQCSFYLTDRNGRIVNDVQAGEEYHVIFSSPVIQESTIEFCFFTYID